MSPWRSRFVAGALRRARDSERIPPVEHAPDTLALGARS
jgi:hypothetical protein